MKLNNLIEENVSNLTQNQICLLRAYNEDVIYFEINHKWIDLHFDTHEN